MGRYTLMNSNKKVPYFTQVHLNDIDRLTTTVEDEDELKKGLEEAGITSINKMHVYYRTKKEEKVLPILDKEFNFLSKLKIENDIIDVNDSIFRSKVSEIINKLRVNPDLQTAIYNSCSVNNKVKEYLEKNILEYTTFNYDKLLHHLREYIQFRKLLLFVEEFEKLGYAPKEKTKEDYADDSLDFLLR